MYLRQRRTAEGKAWTRRAGEHVRIQSKAEPPFMILDGRVAIRQVRVKRRRLIVRVTSTYRNLVVRAELNAVVVVGEWENINLAFLPGLVDD